MRLMPMVVIMYIMNYLDRNNIAAARLGGLEEDLGLKGTEYQVCRPLSYKILLLASSRNNESCYKKLKF